MGAENIAKFSQAAAASPELQTKVQAIHATAAREAADKIAALSADTDAPFSAEEFLANASAQEAVLSDEQLETVAGGTWNPNAGNIVASIFVAAACMIVAIASAGRGSVDRCQMQH